MIFSFYSVYFWGELILEILSYIILFHVGAHEMVTWGILGTMYTVLLLIFLEPIFYLSRHLVV